MVHIPDRSRQALSWVARACCAFDSHSGVYTERSMDKCFGRRFQEINPSKRDIQYCLDSKSSHCQQARGRNNYVETCISPHFGLWPFVYNLNLCFPFCARLLERRDITSIQLYNCMPSPSPHWTTPHKQAPFQLQTTRSVPHAGTRWRRTGVSLGSGCYLDGKACSRLDQKYHNQTKDRGKQDYHTLGSLCRSRHIPGHFTLKLESLLHHCDTIRRE
jgi:hypothetical protein